MVGRVLQIFRLDSYPDGLGRKSWRLCYPAYTVTNKDIPDYIKEKKQVFEIMTYFILPGMQSWNHTRFKVIHPCGRSCLRKMWDGYVFIDGKVKQKVDNLGDRPFYLK